MRTTTKRLWSVLLAIALLAGIISGGAYATANAPFSVSAGGVDISSITAGEVTWTDWQGNASQVPSYTVTVPQGTESVVLTFDEEMQCCYYSSTGSWIGYLNNDYSMPAATKHTAALQDANKDGELDGISVQTPNTFATDYYIQFAYAESGEPTACLTVLEDAPATGKVTTGGLYRLNLSTVFADAQGHTPQYSFETSFSNQHTKIADGVFYFSNSTVGSYDVTLKAVCDAAEVTHTLTITVEKSGEGIPAQYGYDETDKASVTVYVTLSNNGYPIMGTDGTAMSHLKVTVPYFDLGLYGLENCYRYGTDGGKGAYTGDTVIQRPTGLHLYIYLLERYYMGLPEEECCLGFASGVLDYSENTDVFYADGELAYNSNSHMALNLSGNATSIYMANFWGHDENLMYFRNHCYPYMSTGWGATSDYILLSDGDTWDVAMFSNWNFYHSGCFAKFEQDEYTANSGEEVTVKTQAWGTTSEAVDFADKNGLSVGLYDSNWSLLKELPYDTGDGSTLTFEAPQTAGTYYLMALDPHARDVEQANTAPGTARLIVGGTSSKPVDISSCYEDYDFISVKDDQDRYLVDIVGSTIETQYNGTVPVHQITVEEGTETVYVTFPAEKSFVQYTGTYSVSEKADSGYGKNVIVTVNDDQTVTVGIPIEDYTETGTGVYLENSSYAFAYGFDFVIGTITEVETGGNVPVSRILLNTYEKTMIYNNRGNTFQLTATVLPAEATQRTVTWSSSAESVATVDQNGLVTAVGEGQTVITAAIGMVKAQCVITSEAYNTAPVAAAGIPSRTKVKTGTPVSLSIAGMFTDEQNDALTYTAALCKAAAVGNAWEYSYTEQERVEISGEQCTVTIADPGVYALKITANDGALSTSFTYQITVVPNDSGVVKLNDGVSLDFYNVAVVDSSEEFVEDFEIPYKGTHDTTVHHIVLSKNTVSGTPHRKMDIHIQDGYGWSQYAGTPTQDANFSTRADIGLFAYDLSGNITAHFLQFHTECQTHTDENGDGRCDVCTMRVDAMSDDNTYGDIDSNGVIDLTDVSVMMQYINNSTTLIQQQLAACDVDGSGKVDMTDVSVLLQYVNGIITQFPAARNAQ